MRSIFCYFFFFLLPVGATTQPAKGDFEASLEQGRQWLVAGQKAQAGALCRELSSSLDTSAQRGNHASLLTLQGSIARATGDWKEAMRFHQRALAIRLAVFGKKSEPASSSLLNLGNCQLQAGHLNEAKHNLLKALDIKIALFGKHDPRLLNTLNSLGACHEKLGEVRQARDCFASALRIGQQALPADDPALVPLFTNLSDLYVSQNMTDSALALLRQAHFLQTKSNGGQNPSTGLIFNKMGLVFQKTGQHQEAMAFFNKAVEVFRQLPTDYRADHALTLQNMGNCLLEQGDAPSAVLFFNQANNLLEGNPAKQAAVLNSLGLAQLYMGVSDEAASTFDLALDLLATDHAQSSAGAELLAGIYQNLGTCLLVQENFASALAMYRRSADLLAQLPANQTHLFNVMAKLTDCHIRLGQLEAAGQSLRQAAATLTRPLAAQSFAIHFLQGTISQNKNDLHSAIGSFRKAVETAEKDGDLPFESIQALSALSAAHAGAGQWEEALHHSAQAVEKLEKLPYFSNNDPSANHLKDALFEPYQIAVQANLQMGNPAGAFLWSERSRTGFLHRLALRSAKPGGQVQLENLDRQIADLKKQRFLENARLPAGTGHLLSTTQLDSAILALLLQRQSVANAGQVPAAYSPLSPTTIQQALHPDETLLQYHWGQQEIVLFLLQRECFEVMRIPLENDLPETIAKLHHLSSSPYDLLDAAAASRNFREWADISHRLYQLLIAPALPYLHGRRLTIVPDGLLCYVSFALLVENLPKEPSFFRTHDYLLRKYDIRYLATASLAAGQMADQVGRPGEGVLVVAPSFEGNSFGWHPLKNNLLESEAVLARSTGRALTGKAATEEGYLAHLAHAHILHFSTHGILNDHAPAYSYLAFSEISDSLENERLFVSEINQQPLQASLVVLSACQTAAGKLLRGEGLASMAQAFLRAGARSIVASLWNVDDQETPLLMGHFYGALANGADQPAALRQAQLAHLEKASHKKAHPYYWAGFVHFGDVAPLEISRRGYPSFGKILGALLVFGLAGLGFFFWRRSL